MGSTWTESFADAYAILSIARAERSMASPFSAEGALRLAWAARKLARLDSGQRISPDGSIALLFGARNHATERVFAVYFNNPLAWSDQALSIASRAARLASVATAQSFLLADDPASLEQEMLTSEGESTLRLMEAIEPLAHAILANRETIVSQFPARAGGTHPISSVFWRSTPDYFNAGIIRLLMELAALDDFERPSLGEDSSRARRGSMGVKLAAMAAASRFDGDHRRQEPSTDDFAMSRAWSELAGAEPAPPALDFPEEFAIQTEKWLLSKGLLLPLP